MPSQKSNMDIHHYMKYYLSTLASHTSYRSLMSCSLVKNPVWYIFHYKRPFICLSTNFTTMNNNATWNILWYNKCYLHDTWRVVCNICIWSRHCSTVKNDFIRKCNSVSHRNSFIRQRYSITNMIWFCIQYTFLLYLFLWQRYI